MAERLEYQDFLQEVVVELERSLGEEYQVEVKTVLKNNGVKRNGVIIGYKDNNVRPTIYLEEYYQEYLNDVSMEKIISEIIITYQKAQAQHEYEGVQYTLDTMVDKIVFRVINLEQNKELLNESPHLPFMQDLVVVFYCIAKASNDGISSIRITNEHMKNFGLSLSELQNIAMSNTRRMFPEVIGILEDILLNLFEEANDINAIEDIESIVESMKLNSSMFVLTNNRKTFGAGCLMYPDVLQKFANLIKEDVIILPSSIHETILLPATKEKEMESLRAMVREINSTMVSKEEILSDNIYIYHRDTNEIKIA